MLNGQKYEKKLEYDFVRQIYFIVSSIPVWAGPFDRFTDLSLHQAHLNNKKCDAVHENSVYF